MNYCFLSYRYTPNMCKPIMNTLVISEDIEDFVYRNERSEEVIKWNARFELLQWKQTSKTHYDKLKKNNPGSCSYIELKKEDYP